ncbi:MAG TPA: aldolase [Mycobacteriales bacterium]|nr:aldolase [Mycobacteriales bacterium]
MNQAIVELGASLFARGFCVGSAGNISVRTDDGFLMTPTNSSLGRLEADSLSILDSNFRHIGGDRPTKEVVMHRACYEARPDAQAVVHLHSTFATALACLPDAELPPLTPYFVMRVGERLPVVPYFRPGDPAMEAAVREACRRGRAVLLANHGSLVAGSSLVDAVNVAEELEETAHLALLLHDRDPRRLTPAQIAELT